MKKSWIILAAICVVALTAKFSLAADNYKIGVLAKNGPVKALEMWKATGDYLSQKIDGMTFEVVPLGFDEVYPAIANKKVDFFLVNSSMYVTDWGFKSL